MKHVISITCNKPLGIVSKSLDIYKKLCIRDVIVPNALLPMAFGNGEEKNCI